MIRTSEIGNFKNKLKFILILQYKIFILSQFHTRNKNLFDSFLYPEDIHKKQQHINEMEILELK